MLKKVERLTVNFKTVDQLMSVYEGDVETVRMVQDIEAKIAENSNESTYHGIYLADKLVAYMNLIPLANLEVEGDYLSLREIKVFTSCCCKGYGTTLLQHAKSFNLPILAVTTEKSAPFFAKNGFTIDGTTAKWFPEAIH